MDNSEKHLSKILSLIILCLLIAGLILPVMSGTQEYTSDSEMNSEVTTDNIDTLSDDEWLITGTVYVNSSRQIDSHITITGDGELIINDSTLTLLIDEYHPWEIQIWDGGRLELNNSIITTQPKEDLLRPFIKTNISAHNGSEILMEQDSTFRFPGWVYIQGSTFTMRNSSFDRVPDDRIPFESSMLINDNNDCPRLTVVDDSKILIEDSEINDYYRHGGLDDREMEWRSFIDVIQEEDGNYYEIDSGDSLNIDTWYLHDPLLPIGNYRYVNPYNRISALYLEIRYDTEDNYTASSPVEYNVNGEWKTATTLEYSEFPTDDHSDIWELDIDEFYKGEYDGIDHFLKDLEVRIVNQDFIDENKTILIDKINLVSQYNNDIYIRDSDVKVINSDIDVDYRAANTDPREGAEFKQTDNTNWMQDANLQRSAIRLIDSSFKSYGVHPQDTWEPESDPFLIADENSENKTWYTRWVTVTAVDNAGTPLQNTEITATLDGKYFDISPELYQNVIYENDLFNNPEAWDYLNRTGAGYYDIENSTFITDGSGQVTLFLVSDRVNHPQDWPNTRSVGDYFIQGEHNEVGSAEGEINLESFPNMNRTATSYNFELVFDGEIPLPDFNVTNEDLRITLDGDEVSYVTLDSELELTLNVTNTGEKSVHDEIDVGFWLYSQEMNINIHIANATIYGLDTLESKETSVIFDTSEFDIDVGEYDILAFVDPLEEYNEESIDNNIAEKSLTISTKANLQPSVLSAIPDYTVVEGEPLYLQAGVENIGGTDANDVRVAFYYDDGEEYIGSDHIDLPGNFTFFFTDEIEWNYPGPGEYNITVIVDPDGDIDEIDKTNNELSETVTVLAESDITTQLYVDPIEVYDGEQVYMEGTIENTGEAISPEMFISFYIDDELVYSEYHNGLPGGESDIISYQWTAEMITEELSEIREIKLIVEPEDEDPIEEVTELTIRKPAHISISEDDISFTTELSQRGETLEILAEIHNLGGAEAVVDVSFYDGFPDEGSFIDAHSNLVVGPDSSETAFVEWTPENRGNRQVHVIAEYNDATSEEDNHAVVTKPIFSQGYERDLIIGGDGFPNERVITGSYNREGFVVVQGSGELIIRGTNPRAEFGLIMDRDNRYSIFVRDQGLLEIDYGWLRSEHEFDIHLEDESNFVVMRDSRIPNNINLISKHGSTVIIDDTTFEASMDISGDIFTAEESQFTSQDVRLSPSFVEITNSTFQADLVHFHNTEGSLTRVETGAVEATGDSEIELYRWVRATALSKTRLTIQGAEVTAENLDWDYSVTGVTDGQGITYLKVFTDLITDDDPAFYGNYEFSAEYTPSGAEQSYHIETFTESLPHYNSQQYVIDYEMHFEDLAIPDLSISENDIYTDIDEIKLGDEVSIYADVENVGETEAFGVDVYFYNDVTGEEIGVDNLDSVPTEGTITASITWTAEMIDEMQPFEDIDIRVWVDPDVEPLSDPNLDNNEAIRPIRVRSLPEATFDSEIILWRDGDILTEDDQIVDHDELVVNVRLENIGGTDLINGTVNITVSGTHLATENIDVESGEVFDYTYNWTVRMIGEQNIEVWFNTSEVDQDGIPISTAYTSRTISIERMTLEFSASSLLETEPGADKIVEGILVRNDGRPIPNMDVTAYLLDQDGLAVQHRTTTTNEEGEFLMYIPEPATSGRYTLGLEADYPDEEMIVTGESIEVGEPVETGIPLWMIIAVIGAIAAGSVGGIFAYIKFQGPDEWVECGNCGTTIPADVKECPECGVEFETETVKCSECGEWIPYDSEECPKCGSEFIKTGKEVQDYEQTMKQQYENYVDKQKNRAKTELGEDFTEEEFMDWWQEQPSYISFDEWLEREEARRKEGGIECLECGALNSVDDAICQKCGSTLITLDEEIDDEDIDVDLSDTDDMLGIDIETDEAEESAEEIDDDLFDDKLDEPIEEEAQDKPKKVVRKKVKKTPKKVVKKKVKKKPKKNDEESE